MSDYFSMHFCSMVTKAMHHKDELQNQEQTEPKYIHRTDTAYENNTNQQLLMQCLKKGI